MLDWFSQVINGIDQLQRQLSAIHADVTVAANRLEGSGRTSEVLELDSPVRSRPQGTSNWSPSWHLVGGSPRRGQARCGAPRTAAKHVTLAVDNEPCNEGRWSCDRLLSRILKPGQTVTIHWPGGEQTYRWKEAQR
ncbi:DddA-like double-stranded DNA deaminase toxin [Lentzea sp. NPDC051208]|uniref:DddA-like double-stranded DNA deaminase toxin n=1 Tax=Lentzea sp. NPDC051208 TaxID=3154642 RepID=UPI00343523B8